MEKAELNKLIERATNGDEVALKELEKVKGVRIKYEEVEEVEEVIEKPVDKVIYDPLRCLPDIITRDVIFNCGRSKLMYNIARIVIIIGVFCSFIIAIILPTSGEFEVGLFVGMVSGFIILALFFIAFGMIMKNQEITYLTLINMYKKEKNDKKRMK